MNLLSETWLSNLKPRLGEFSLGGRIADLVSNPNLAPRKPGVYLIARQDLSSLEPAAFVETGTGGAFKGKNPNVSIEILNRKWVLGTNVLYIGKAGGKSANLASRLRTFFRFGQGLPVPHRGGRYIWQLPTPEELLVYWCELENIAPREVEREMLLRFEEQYGRLPFANLNH